MLGHSFGSGLLFSSTWPQGVFYRVAYLRVLQTPGVAEVHRENECDGPSVPDPWAEVLFSRDLGRVSREHDPRPLGKGGASHQVNPGVPLP